jgi:TolA-binding protein
LKLYVRAAEDYKDSTVAPRALFDSGRLYEAKSDWANAQKAYQSMDGLYAQSRWTRLAKNRLVELKVQGKTK